MYFAFSTLHSKAKKALNRIVAVAPEIVLTNSIVAVVAYVGVHKMLVAKDTAVVLMLYYFSIQTPQSSKPPTIGQLAPPTTRQLQSQLAVSIPPNSRPILLMGSWLPLTLQPSMVLSIVTVALVAAMSTHLGQTV